MEVRKEKIYTGYFTYRVVSSKYIKVAPPDTLGSSFWSILVPNIEHGGVTEIYSARTLNKIKEVLSGFNSEEELLGFYYKARIEGRRYLFESPNGHYVED